MATAWLENLYYTGLADDYEDTWTREQKTRRQLDVDFILEKSTALRGMPEQWLCGVELLTTRQKSTFNL